MMTMNHREASETIVKQYIGPMQEADKELTIDSIEKFLKRTFPYTISQLDPIKQIANEARAKLENVPDNNTEGPAAKEDKSK